MGLAGPKGRAVGRHDPQERRAYVYRAAEEVEVLENPRVLSGAPELPGFLLDLEPIWHGG